MDEDKTFTLIFIVIITLSISLASFLTIKEIQRMDEVEEKYGEAVNQTCKEDGWDYGRISHLNSGYFYCVKETPLSGHKYGRYEIEGSRNIPLSELG